MTRHPLIVPALLAALTSTATVPALADELARPRLDEKTVDTRSMWSEKWPEFSTLEGSLALSAALGTVMLYFIGPDDEPRWTGGVLFDDSVRDAARVDDPGTRATLRSVGDFTYYAAPLIPFAVDVFLVSLVVRQDTKLARNLALTSAEAFAYSGLLSFVSTKASARERPDSTACLQEHGGDETQCELDSRTESFISGHTMISATSAGIVCANHVYMPLWGHPAADAAACGLGVAAALTTAVTRIGADRHYATDAILASGVGFGIGYAVPTLLHYTAAPPAIVVPNASDEGAGITVSAAF